MFISRIRPDPRKIVARQDRESVLYSFHRLIWDLFPVDRDANRDFLFRLDYGDEGGTLLVVSDRQPASPEWARSFDTKAYSPVLSQGQEISFKVRVNPVVRGKSDRKRHDVVMHSKTVERFQGYSHQETVHSACFSWLNQRGERNGFRIHEQGFHADGYRQETVSDGGRMIRISIVDLSGILTVEDPTTFSTCLRDGIGGSKSLGCGLFLVRRAA